MEKALRYLSISHQRASVKQREKFYIAESKKEEVLSLIGSFFPDITGLLLLVTCNRTEVYFESDKTSATSLLHFLMTHLFKEDPTVYQPLFTLSDTTGKSVEHLLEVSSGLVSKVMGDAEIVYQIRKAYQKTLQHNLQGSLLERAMQTVFKCHKRIRNETHFRDGTTSVAYKALKLISETYGKEAARKKKILIIGAGDIVQQLFKYNLKFGFERIYISNRTKHKAQLLIRRYLGHWFDWNKVLENDFEDFDILIGAAGNCPLLVRDVHGSSRPRLLIDLSLPGNINVALARKEHILFYDLDAISMELEGNKSKRWAAVSQVQAIKKEELDEFKSWYLEAPLRKLLSAYKITLDNGIAHYLKRQGKALDATNVKLISDRIMRALVKHPDPPILPNKIEALIAAHAQPDKII